MVSITAHKQKFFIVKVFQKYRISKVLDQTYVREGAAYNHGVLVENSFSNNQIK